MSSTAHPAGSARTARNGNPAATIPVSFLERELFVTMLRLERKRTERSNRRFVLMLMEATSLLNADRHHATFGKVIEVLTDSIRETDIKGWYEENAVIGVIFTEIGAADGRSVANALLTKVTRALSTVLTIEQINEVKLSFHVFPEPLNGDGGSGPSDSTLYPDLQQRSDPKRTARVIKRSIDIAGSLFALILTSPLLLLIALLIRLTSRGPILFRQQRVGQYGRRFMFLKFRSMYHKNDATAHREYVKRLIAGENPEQETGRTLEVYKLRDDPRVTPLGKLLRKTSVDEIPQFLNVLAGSMSLVGPRPPIPYEFDAYEMWHKQRLVAVKPGITGQWQISGRSRTTFDEMVRMDLKYSSSWTVWGDLKILSKTPRAVLSGEGAY